MVDDGVTGPTGSDGVDGAGRAPVARSLVLAGLVVGWGLVLVGGGWLALNPAGLDSFWSLSSLPPIAALLGGVSLVTWAQTAGRHRPGPAHPGS